MEYRLLRFCLEAMSMIGFLILAGAVVLLIVGGFEVLAYPASGLRSPSTDILKVLNGLISIAKPALVGLLLITGTQVIEVLIRLEQNTRKS